MDRRQFLQFLGGAAVASAQIRRPLNFVFILIDDMGWADLGCYGGKSYDTPNIDRLADQMNQVARHYGEMIGVKYGEPFLQKELMKVADVVKLEVRSM